MTMTMIMMVIDAIAGPETITRLPHAKIFLVGQGIVISELRSPRLSGGAVLAGVEVAHITITLVTPIAIVFAIGGGLDAQIHALSSLVLNCLALLFLGGLGENIGGKRDRRHPHFHVLWRGGQALTTPTVISTLRLSPTSANLTVRIARL